MVLGIDPGRDKMGWAIANYDGDLFSAGICPVSEQELFLTALTRKPDSWEYELSPWMTEKPGLSVLRAEKLSLVAAGNGTGSQGTVELLRRLGVKIVVVDEKGTTLEARKLYWSFHGPSWWQRFLPRVMWFPPEALDDLAALVIARRSLDLNNL